jgi:hypothetical protein
MITLIIGVIGFSIGTAIWWSQRPSEMFPSQAHVLIKETKQGWLITNTFSSGTVETLEPIADLATAIKTAKTNYMLFDDEPNSIEVKPAL